MSDRIARMIPGTLTVNGAPRATSPLFRYFSGDPLAVSLLFGNGDDWWFSRDLLAAGMREGIAGEGDLMVCSDLRVVEIVLRNAEPGVSVSFWFTKILAMLTETYNLVPLGKEQVDIGPFLQSLTEAA